MHDWRGRTSLSQRLASDLARSRSFGKWPDRQREKKMQSTCQTRVRESSRPTTQPKLVLQAWKEFLLPRVGHRLCLLPLLAAARTCLSRWRRNSRRVHSGELSCWAPCPIGPDRHSRLNERLLLRGEVLLHAL